MNAVTKNTRWAGLILLLSSSLLYSQKKFNLANWPGNHTITGANSFDSFGQVVASGDIDGDGLDDLVVSAPSSDPQGRNSAGGVFVFFGSSTLSQMTALNLATNAADVSFYGPTSNSQFGKSIAGEIVTSASPNFSFGGNPSRYSILISPS